VSAASAVRRNAVWLFVGRVIGQVVAVAMTVLLAARLGVVGFGELAFVGAVVLFANVATTFGTDMVLIRDIAGHGRLDRWVAALVVQLALSIVAIALIWLVAPIIPGQRAAAVTALRISAVSLIPAALFSVCTAVLRGVGLMRTYAALGVATVVVQLAAIAAFVEPRSGVVRAVVVLLGVQVVMALAAWAVCVARIAGLGVIPRTTRADVKVMARASVSVGVLGLLGVLYQRLAAIAVAMFVGPAATGWFAGASRVVDASKTGHLALFGAVYPAMAEERSAAPPTDRRPSELGWSWRLCVLLGGLVTAALLLLGPFIIDVLYPATFGPSKTALAILALTVVPSTVATYQSLTLLAEHREDETLRVLLISVTVLAALLVVLIPAIGWVGACWAVLGADTTQAVLMLRTRAGSDLRLARRRRPMVRPADATAGLG
jgi:O-antigen/teichoic acid export membrane protein